MKKLGFLQRIWSHLFGITLRKYTSSHSGHLYVGIENGKKVLNTDSVNYSFNSLHRVFQAAFANTQIEKQTQGEILVLGLGGGSILQILREEYSIIAPITVVEIDPTVIEIANNEFDIYRFGPLKVIESDAAIFIEKDTNQYNIICIDLFINNKVPDQFLTISFMDKIIELLTIPGILYFNIMISDADSQAKFDTIQHYLQSNKNITSVNFLEIEENNRVLMVRK